MTQQRKSLKLSLNEWGQLDHLAEALGILATRGPQAGQPSWRALVRHIAQGRLGVSKTNLGGPYVLREDAKSSGGSHSMDRTAKLEHPDRSVFGNRTLGPKANIVVGGDNRTIGPKANL